VEVVGKMWRKMERLYGSGRKDVKKNCGCGLKDMEVGGRALRCGRKNVEVDGKKKCGSRWKAVEVSRWKGVEGGWKREEVDVRVWR
jgi:hypothetical protein